MTPFTRRDKNGELRNPTVRVTNNIYAGTYNDARGRKLVIKLMPGDVIAVKPAGTRRWEYVTMSALYDRLLRCRVLGDQMIKLNNKRRRKS